jgi:hypothetical protein
VNHENAVTKGFDLIHLIGAQDQGLIRHLLIYQAFLEQIGVDRIQTGKGFVQDDRLGIVDNEGNELHQLPHALEAGEVDDEIPDGQFSG